MKTREETKILKVEGEQKGGGEQRFSEKIGRGNQPRRTRSYFRIKRQHLLKEKWALKTTSEASIVFAG